MIKDPIVAQIRKIREEYAAQFNHDLEAIFEDLKKWEKETGHTYDSPPKRKRAAKKAA